jgi:hypothetical protein
MGEGGGQRGTVGLIANDRCRAADRSERAGMQRDGECVEGMSAEPDERRTQSQQRNAQPGPGESREHE